MDYKIGFSGKAINYSVKEIEAVVNAMNAETLTQGKQLLEFEKKVSNYTGGEFCFGVNNGTSALELSAQLCQFEEGDELILPSHTFTASAYPFLKNSAKLVWADIDIKTRVITAETITKLITPKTKAILVVHLYGYLADMNEIMEVAKKYNLIVIEDAAQAIGTRLNGKHAGTFGDFGIFSFHSHKNLTTLGEGGMLVVKDKKHADLIPQLRHNGHCAFSFDRKDYWKPAMGNVDLPELNGKPLLPNNFCIGEIECALGTKLLDRIDQINQEKRLRAISFIDSLKKYDLMDFHRVDSDRHNYHLLVARVRAGKRNELMEELVYRRKIQCVVQYYPLNRYPFYQKLGYGDADCPNSDEFFDNMISFPFHHWMSDGDFEYVLNSTRDTLKKIS